MENNSFLYNGNPLFGIYVRVLVQNLYIRISIHKTDNKGLNCKKEKRKSKLLFRFVPRPGIEPGWVAPLVFETSASTDSAIWAFVATKVGKVFEVCKCFLRFLMIKGKSL